MFLTRVDISWAYREVRLIPLYTHKTRSGYSDPTRELSFSPPVFIAKNGFESDARFTT